MSKDSYTKFTEICANKRVDSFIRDCAFGIYKNKVSVAAKIKQESDKQQALTQQELSDLENTFLNEDFVEDYVKEAIRSYEKRRELDFQPYFKESNGGGFWKSVGASILASFVYSVLLVVIFYIAKDQIETWLKAVSG